MATIDDKREIVQKLYIAFYGRPADPGGLMYWALKIPDRVDFDSREFRDLVVSFVNSEEAMARFGSPSVEASVKRIFTYAFGRDATGDDVSRYAKATVIDLLIDVLKLNSGTDYEVLRRKIEYAMIFTEILDPNRDGKPNDDPTGSKFMATFFGNTDAEVAKALVLLNTKSADFTRDSVLSDMKKYIADPGDPLLISYDSGSLLELARSKSMTNFGYGEIADRYVYEVLALDSGVKWSKKTITFSFLTSDPRLGYSEWRPLDELQREVVRETFRKVSSYVDLSFVEVSTGGDILFGSANLGRADGLTMWSVSTIDRTIISPVYVHFDNELQQQRDRYFFKTEFGYSGRGVYVIMHEIGHALGLKHPFEPPHPLEDEVDNISLTVMSYNDDGTASPYFTFDGREISGIVKYSHTPTNFSLFDYETLQAKYGARVNSNLGNTVYDRDYFLRTNQPYFAVIWDAGGNDTLDLRFHKGSCTVILSDGSASDLYFDPKIWIEYWTEEISKQGADRLWARGFIEDYVRDLSEEGILYGGVNALAIVSGTIIENVITGDYDDWIEDNRYDNLIQTGGGSDVIYVSGGFDTVVGGEGYDKVYLEIEKYVVTSGVVDNAWVFVGDDFAVKLIGVEEVVFKDGSVFLV